MPLGLKTALSLAVVFIFVSCAPQQAVRKNAPQNVVAQERIDISEDEVKYWQTQATLAKDTVSRAEAEFWVGQYYFNKNEEKPMFAYFEQNEKYYKDTIWGYLSSLRLAQYYQKKNNAEAYLKKLSYLLDGLLQFPEFAPTIKQKVTEMLTSLDDASLNTLYLKHAHKIIDEKVLALLLTRAEGTKDYETYLKYGAIYLNDFKDGENYASIIEKFKIYGNFKPVAANKLAVIIPMADKHMDIGTVIKNSIDMALSEINAQRAETDKIELFYVDETNEAGLVANMTKLIEDQQIIAILGPLYSKTVTKLMPLLDRYGISMFSSTAAQQELDNKSAYFFRNCSTAKGEAYAIAKYMYWDSGIKNASIIYPDNTYGSTLRKFFVDKFTSLGGTIIGEASFGPKTTDFQAQIVGAGGINTGLFKEKRADEQMEINRIMDSAGKKALDKIYSYFKIMPELAPIVGEATATTKTSEATTVAILHLAPQGEDVKKFKLDTDMTVKMSYALAKGKNINVIKQKTVDATLEDIGIGYEEIDREFAMSAARQLNAKVLIWGTIKEGKSNTPTANFMPVEIQVDAKGNSTPIYKFTEEDYYNFDVVIHIISVADEQQMDEITFRYSKIKEPASNPKKIEAIYAPCSDKNMIMLRPQLNFYDLDVPIFGSEALASGYISEYREDALGVTYPATFYDEDTDGTAKTFVDTYEERYASKPGVIAANSYDLMKIAGVLLAKKIKSREEFKNELKALSGYREVTGNFMFDSEGSPVKEYYLMKVDTDKTKLLKKETGN